MDWSIKSSSAMSGVDFLVDTNILIYILEGNSIMKRYVTLNFAYSVITEMELLGRLNISPQENKTIRDFLGVMLRVEFNNEIKERAISIKQVCNVKLPDAIIAATAQHLNLPLLTADKGFKNIPQLDAMIVDVD